MRTNQRIALTAAGLVLFSFIAVYFPFLFIILPAYFFAETVISNYMNSVKAIIIYSVGVAVFINPILAVYLAVTLLAMAKIYDVSVHGKANIPHAMLIQAAVVYVPMVGIIGSFKALFNTEFRTVVESIMKAQAEKVASYSGTVAKALEPSALTETFMLYLPAIILGWAILGVYLSNKIALKLIYKSKPEVFKDSEPFYLLTLPPGFILGAFIISMTANVLAYITGSNAWIVVQYNLFMLTTFMFFAVGVATVDFYLAQLKISGLFRIIIIGVFVAVVYTVPLFVLVGMLETIFNTRLARLLR